MDDDLFDQCRRELERLEASANVLDARLDAFEGLFAPVLEVDDLEFMIDPLQLRGPARVTVRRGDATAVVWLDHDGASLDESHGLSPFEERRVVRLVEEHLDELSDRWYGLREDLRRGRLGRNLLVD
ncbi:MAG: DUF4160 domain-containing protein [Longimicrobiales bacterium]